MIFLFTYYFTITFFNKFNSLRLYFDFFILIISIIYILSIFYSVIFDLNTINDGYLSYFYLDSPNKNGAILFFVNIFFIYLFEKYSINKIFIFMIIFLFLYLSFMSLSRTHLFSYVLAISLYFYFQISDRNFVKFQKVKVFIFILFFIVVLYLGFNFIDKFSVNFINMVISGRLITWIDKLLLILNSNLLGCGIGCYNIQNDTISNAFDSLYLKLFFELGLIGVYLFVILIYRIMQHSYSKLKFIILVYFLVSGIGYEVFFINVFSIFFFFYIAYLPSQNSINQC